MPGHKLHKSANKAVLGKDYEDVNKLLDFPQRFMGPAHRKYFHDHTTPFLVLAATRDTKKAMAAVLHIMLDKSMTCKQGNKIEKLLRL